MTPTPTSTPTATPTPTPTTVASCSGKPYVLSNLLTTPSSGESLWLSNTIPATVLNLVNILGTNSSVLYFNEIDNDGTDQTTYFGNAVGTSFTVTLCQNGNSAIYSGTNSAMVYDSFNYSYFLDATKLSLIQSSTVSTFTFGEVFYVGILVSGQSTPTPTPLAATSTPTPTVASTSTPTPTPTSAPTSTPTPLPATATPTPSATATNTPTPTPVPAGVGSWYLYYNDGDTTAPPPGQNGNVIFYDTSTSPFTDNFSPNYSGGTRTIRFNPTDITATNYLSQFSGLTNGGTITLVQNGDSATYYSSSNDGSFVISSFGVSYFTINTNIAIQTKSSNNKFNRVDPISITFGS